MATYLYYSAGAGLWASGTAISPRSARCRCRRWLHGHGRRRHGGLGCAHGLGDHRICRPDAHGRVSTGSGSGGPAWTTTLLLLPGACARVRDEATSAHLTETLAPGGVGPIPTKIMQAALHWQAAVRFDGNTGPVDRKARLLRYARMCDNADLHGLARGHVYRLYFG